MRDFHRLCGLLAIVAIAACGPKQTKKPVDDLATETVEPGGDVAWPTPQRTCGDAGNWCAPASQVQSVATHSSGGEAAGEGEGEGEGGAEAEEGSACPEAFMREPYTYTLDVEATSSSMGGNCCYAYQGEKCMP